MPSVRVDGQPVRILPRMQRDHPLPRQHDPASTSTKIAAADGPPAADPQHEAQPGTDPVSAAVPGTEADESKSETDTEAEDKATRKRKCAARNKENRKLTWQKKAEAAKAALSEEYSAGTPCTLAELCNEMS